MNEQSILDRRIVTHEGMRASAGFVVHWLLENYMVPEGYTAGEIDEGPVITVSFFFERLRMCLGRIEEITGGAYSLDVERKVVSFQMPTREQVSQ